VIAVTVLVVGTTMATAGTVAGSATTTVPSGNLVQNPGAEDSPGTDVSVVVKPAGWETTGNLSSWTYAAAEGDRPTKAFAATIGGGKNFFAGGQRSSIAP